MKLNCFLFGHKFLKFDDIIMCQKCGEMIVTPSDDEIKNIENDHKSDIFQ